jgi:hypothetical protein
MPPSGMLRRVSLLRTDISEERIATIIRVTRIGELGTALAVTSNRSRLRRNTTCMFIFTSQLHVTNKPPNIECEYYSGTVHAISMCTCVHSHTRARHYKKKLFRILGVDSVCKLQNPEIVYDHSTFLQHVLGENERECNFLISLDFYFQNFLP